MCVYVCVCVRERGLPDVTAHEPERVRLCHETSDNAPLVRTRCQCMVARLHVRVLPCIVEKWTVVPPRCARGEGYPHTFCPSCCGSAGFFSFLPSFPFSFFRLFFFFLSRRRCMYHHASVNVCECANEHVLVQHRE